MHVTFLEREFEKGKIEWGITPIYLMAIQKKNPLIWQEFITMINKIDDGTLRRILSESNSDLSSEAPLKKGR